MNNRTIKIPVLISILIFLCYWVNTLEAHGYAFGKSNEEMRDDIKVTVGPARMVVEYQATYQGQIAPHIRNLIDKNRDFVLTEDEVEQFLYFFKNTFNERYRNNFLTVNGQPCYFILQSIQLPGILQDSLLAPLQVRVTLRLPHFETSPGQNDLEIDPRFFFLTGDHFIQLAKEYVEFTEEQESRIGRYLQVEIYASPSLIFTSTFPGRIRRDKKSVYIYGVFYDENLKKLRNNLVPKMRISLTRTGTQPDIETQALNQKP